MADIKDITVKNIIAKSAGSVSGNVFDIISTTELEGFIVPNLTAEDIVKIYNSFISGIVTYIKDSTNTYYNIQQVDNLNSEEIGVSFFYFDKMKIEFLLNTETDTVTKKGIKLITQSNTIIKSGSVVDIDIIEDVDYECKDKVSSLTINSSGGLKKISKSFDYPSFYAIIKFYKKWYIGKFPQAEFSSDLETWNNSLSELWDNVNGYIVGENIIIAKNSCADIHDLTKPLKQVFNFEIRHNQQIVKDGYIYVHFVGSDCRIYKIKDDYENVSVEIINLDGEQLYGITFYNGYFYFAKHNSWENDVIYRTQTIEDANTYEEVYRIPTNRQIKGAFLIKDNFACVFVNNDKIIYTTDNFRTTQEIEVSEYETNSNYFTETLINNTIYYVKDKKVFYRNIDNIKEEGIIDFSSSESSSIDIATDGNKVIFFSDYLYSYSTPQPLPTTETNIYFTTGSETPTLVDNANLKWLNSNSIEADNEYVLSIKRGYAVIGKVQQ